MKGFKNLAAILAALAISTATVFAFGCIKRDGKLDVIGNVNGIVSSAGNNKNDSEKEEVIVREYEIDKFIADTKFEMESPVYHSSSSSGMGLGIDLVKTVYMDLTELKDGADIFEKSFIDEQAKNATVTTINSASGKIFDASDLNGVAEGLADTFNINVSSEVKKAMYLTNARNIVDTLHGFNNFTNNYYFVLTKFLNGYSLRFPAYTEDLSVCKANLSTYFIRDIEQVINGTMAYEQFFKMYGTHVIMEGIFGGKVNLCYGARSNSYDVGGTYRSAITAEIKSTFEGGDDNNKLSIPNIACRALNCTVEDVSESFAGRYCGGIPFPSFGINDFLNGYTEWLPEIDEDNVLISFTENGAVPIWKLLPEEYESYSAEFEQALNNYAVKYSDAILNV